MFPAAGCMINQDIAVSEDEISISLNTENNELIPYPNYKLNYLEWNSLRNQLHICWFIDTSLGCVVALRTLTTQLHREHSIPCHCCCQTVQRWMTDQVEVEGSVENIHIRMRTSLSVCLSVCLSVMTFYPSHCYPTNKCAVMTSLP